LFIFVSYFFVTSVSARASTDDEDPRGIAPLWNALTLKVFIS